MKEKKEVAVGRVTEFPVGIMKIIVIDGREIGVIRLKTGAFRAVRNHCPHKGAPVCKGIVGGTWLPCGPGEMVYGRDGEVLICPWHGFEFDLLSGAELFQDQPLKLLMYPAAERDGEVLVTL